MNLVDQPDPPKVAGGEAERQTELIRLRYRDDMAADGPWNEVIATILSHRSVRAFLPTKLPAGTLERLVAAASAASTSSNLQTWSVVAIEDQARKDRLAILGAEQKFISQCPLFLVWCVDHSRLHLAGAERQMTLGGLDYLEPFMVGVVDAALAAQNAAIAAESLGLGFVYIGAMRNRPEDVAAELGLPSGVMGLFGMCVGYADPTRPADIKVRLPQNAVLHREQYHADSMPEVIAAYDPRLVEFQREQAMRETPWTKLATERVKDIEALRGRDRMRQALNNLGFPIR
ncbi:MAG: nitroreductase family protein [Alphaproteobacteria bacterium]|nr:nitroreductase family protein [Alphaproteobacteria bacterium]